MRVIVDWVHSLPLGGIFLATFALSAVGAVVIVVAVRLSLHRLGFGEDRPLALRDAAVNTVSAIFALTMAFSAAGIWQESQQAHAAVQREANALENLYSIAASFPLELRERTRSDIRNYAKEVLAKDWPAMLRRDLSRKIAAVRSTFRKECCPWSRCRSSTCSRPPGTTRT